MEGRRVSPTHEVRLCVSIRRFFLTILVVRSPRGRIAEWEQRRYTASGYHLDR